MKGNTYSVKSWTLSHSVSLEEWLRVQYKTKPETGLSAAGDTFHCHRFTVGMPLFLDDYRHADEPPSLFVVGNRGGLTAFSL